MAKSYLAKTLGNTVGTIEEVEVEISTSTTLKETITFGAFKTRLAKEKELRDGYIASIVDMQAEQDLVQTEAAKVILKP